MRVANNIAELIGQTPIVKVNTFTGPDDAEVYIKLESFNPGGSVKDRIGYSMIVEAEREGKIAPGKTTIVEPTSGNTGIGLAMVAAAKGYKTVIVMPETMSIERRNLLKAYGAELVLTPGAEGMKGAIAKANQLQSENEGWFMPQQFDNPANPKIHRETTALEILEALPDVDAFVAGVGTGGTITGVGEVLKSKNPNVQVVAVEPASSPVLSGGAPGAHKIQGLGAGFVPSVTNIEIFDEIIQVENETAFEYARRLAKDEGILVGISSGANLYAALQVAKKLGKGKKVLTVAPSTGERYLSTPLFQFE